MSADPIIYFPYKEYDVLKPKLHDRALKYFEELSKKAKVDETLNKKHVKDYEEQLSKQESVNKSLSKAKAALTVSIVFTVLLFIAAFILVFASLINFEKLWWLLIISGVCFLIAIGLVVLIIVKLSKDVKKGNKRLSEEKAISQKLLNICYKDMEVLNSLFDYNIPLRMVDDAIDIIEIDENVGNVRLSDLVHNYGFKLEADKSGTTLGAISGVMLNNPFVLIKDEYRSMINKTYTGSIVVTVRVRRTDSKGRSYITHEPQTLTATSVHPAPSYNSNTQLFYACDAAPHLTFSRGPSKASSMDEKAREKYVRSHIKDIIKQSDEAIKKGKSNFTPTGNDHFDVFFGANNRDNEIEFRLLYNSLAQQNTMKVITSPSPFGDDFSFTKKKKINIISSGHSMIFNYFVSPSYYSSYSIEKAKNTFVNYVDDYFKNLYFDFVPLLSIPEYQIYKGHPLDKNKYEHNYSMIEEEVMANHLNKENFRPKGSDSLQEIILSFKDAKRVGNIDIVSINASSFATFPETDYVPRMARDGVTHLVPVHWTRYDEISEIKQYGLYHSDITLQQFRAIKDALPEEYIDKRNIHFERGLFAFTFKRMPDNNLNEKLNSLFKNIKV